MAEINGPGSDGGGGGGVPADGAVAASPPGGGLDVAMAQHLLAAADLLQLERLRRIAERRLVECVEVDSVADTLALADKNHAEELKKVGLGARGEEPWCVSPRRRRGIGVTAEGQRNRTGNGQPAESEVWGTRGRGRGLWL